VGREKERKNPLSLLMQGGEKKYQERELMAKADILGGKRYDANKKILTRRKDSLISWRRTHRGGSRRLRYQVEPRRVKKKEVGIKKEKRDPTSFLFAFNRAPPQQSAQEKRRRNQARRRPLWRGEKRKEHDNIP